MPAIRIDGRVIARYEPPYIVAEISGNHYGNLDAAKQLIRAAANAGANAVKFQCYEPGTITIDCDKSDFILKNGPWKGRKLYELYGKACTPFAWFPALFEEAKKLKISCFASVFDHSSVDLLESLGCPAYKIASMEIVDIPLIDRVVATGKPVIISTGMSIMVEIFEAMERGGRMLPLACVSGYPTPPSEFNLPMLKALIQNYDSVGISDHTITSTIPIAATAMGACMIEKHLCLSRQNNIEDAAFSMEPTEFTRMCREVRATWEAMQGRSPNTENLELRRSIYVVQDIKAGEVLTKENIRSIRPHHGLHPREYPYVLGSKAKLDIERGTPLARHLIEQ